MQRQSSKGHLSFSQFLKIRLWNYSLWVPVSDCSNDLSLWGKRTVNDIHHCTSVWLTPKCILMTSVLLQEKVCHGMSVNNLIILNTSIWSSWILLSFSDHSPSLPSLVWCGKFLKFVNSLVKLCWTRSNRHLSVCILSRHRIIAIFLHCGRHTVFWMWPN